MSITPRIVRPRLVLAVVAAALILPAAGCARNKGKVGDTEYVARDVNTLYSQAKKYLDQGSYIPAAKMFDEVERQHPYSVWARRAQLMSAFSFEMGQCFSVEISSSVRLLTIHPVN
jgi:outer membrane protein assembly factor BamD